MSPRAGLLRHGYQRACMLIALVLDAVRLLRLCLRPSTALAAENLFLRTQLALYQARQVKPRRATNAARLTLVWLAQWFAWRPAAAPRVQTVVAQHIVSWTPAHPGGIASTYPPDGT